MQGVGRQTHNHTDTRTLQLIDSIGEEAGSVKRKFTASLPDWINEGLAVLLCLKAAAEGAALNQYVATFAQISCTKEQCTTLHGPCTSLPVAAFRCKLSPAPEPSDCHCTVAAAKSTLCDDTTFNTHFLVIFVS